MATISEEEQLATEWVRVGHAPGCGTHFVELRGVIDPPVRICAHPNPARAREEAERVQRFVAAVIRAARTGGQFSS